MPRFVILEHLPGSASRAPRHWDFMLERGAALRTWALDGEPQVGQSIAATALADHRLAYLDYEGPITGGRGHVRRYDSGEYRVLHEQHDALTVELAGDRGRLVASFSRDPASSQLWSVRFSLPPA
jgi:hypothetical protein